MGLPSFRGLRMPQEPSDATALASPTGDETARSCRSFDPRGKGTVSLFNRHAILSARHLCTAPLCTLYAITATGIDGGHRAHAAAPSRTTGLGVASCAFGTQIPTAASTAIAADPGQTQRTIPPLRSSKTGSEDAAAPTALYRRRRRAKPSPDRSLGRSSWHICKLLRP